MPNATRLILLSLLLIAGCGSPESKSSTGARDVPADALQAAAKDPGVRAFYAAEDWQAIWSKRSEKALRQALAGRTEHGLDRVVFLVPPADSSPAAREAALTHAALAYAAALAHGLVDPKRLHAIYALPRPDPHLAGGLLGALRTGKLGEWFAGLAPQDAEYRALSLVYRQMNQASNGNASAGISAAGRPIRPGGHDPRVPPIAVQLQALGYLDAAGADAKSDRYTPAMASAVRRLQQDEGLKANGVIGSDTIGVLNTAAADRAAATAVALERRRWLTRDPPATRIDVNIATATLDYIRGGQTVDQRRVIVGEPGWETPQLQARLFRLVANPTWTVPKTIEAKEMSDVSAAYLSRHNMVERDGQIVQLPGPDNALGLVKFDLDDKYAIYLHDTPAKSWFSTDQRARSHGCVRVADALGFADLIAGDEQVTDEWQKARATDQETFVKLPRPIVVRLLYHPTWADAANRVHFDQDVYGWNEAVAEQLGFGQGRAKRLAPAVGDIGP